MDLLFIDCEYSGISGDLLLSSLSSIVGIDKVKDYILKILNNLPVKQNFSIDFISKKTHGMEGIYFDFQIRNHDLNSHLVTTSSEKDQNLVDRAEKHNHSSYKIQDMRKDLNLALNLFDSNENTKKAAKLALEKIISAESQVHGVPLEEVHLHEIGSIDTIIDITGTMFCLQELGVFNQKDPAKIFISPVNVGNGKIKTAHGIMQVPAPATAKILELNQISFIFGDINFELATPTGVAIIASLKEMNCLSEKKPSFPYKIKKIGIGVGSYDLPNQANLLRIFYGQKENLVHDDNKKKHYRPIYKLETNVDDVRGEILGFLITKLMEQGALDVTIIPTITKKNRPGYLISVITNEDDIENLTELLIKETGTLGVRLLKQQRYCLKRKVNEHKISIQGHDFVIHEKIAMDHNGSIVQKKMEFEDLKNVSDILHLSIREVENYLLKYITSKKN
ncbi:MAG: nickel pincer cofactor biosynthesis protein LarC, partial [Promethearchaeota archaeon]